MSLFFVAFLIAQLNYSCENETIFRLTRSENYEAQTATCLKCHHKFDMKCQNKWLYNHKPSCVQCGADLSDEGIADNLDQKPYRSKMHKSEQLSPRLKDGNSPLHYASERGQEFIVRNLLAKNPENVDIQNRHGQTPIMRACKHGHSKIVEILLENGANVNAASHEHGNIPIHYAAKEGWEGVVKILLAKNPKNVNAENKSKETPLMLATLKGHDNVVKILLEKGANVNAVDHKYGLAALHVAALNGEESIAKILVAMNANINVQDKKYRTPLTLAALKKHVTVVKILLERGANP